MAKKKRAGISDKQQYITYKSKSSYSKNRKQDLIKHCKEHPEDQVAAKCLEKGTWPWVRSRMSKGHICNVKKFNTVLDFNREGHLPVSIGEQLFDLGLINVKKYKQPIKRRFRSVL